MIEVFFLTPDDFHQVDSVHCCQDSGKWYYVYDHYENAQFGEFVEIWLPMKHMKAEK